MIFFIGLGTLGALIGLFIAWSESAVVITLIPLLFGLFGGAAGFSAFQLDVSLESDKKKLYLLGGSLAAFASACLIFTIAGVFAKTYILTSNNEETISLADSKDRNDIDLLNSLLLRARLKAIGANRAEIDRVFRLQGQRINYSEVNSAVLAKLKLLGKRYEEEFDKIPNDHNIRRHEEFMTMTLNDWTNKYRKLYLSCKDFIANYDLTVQKYGSENLPDEVIRFLSIFSDKMGISDNAIGGMSYEEREFIQKYNDVFESYVNIVRFIRSREPRSSTDKVISEIDQFIGARRDAPGASIFSSKPSLLTHGNGPNREGGQI
jgi:hypothetical protein